MRVALLNLAFYVFVLFAATASAQQSPPPKRPSAGAHLLRVEYGSSCGACAGYANHETVIEAGRARSVEKTNYSDLGIKDKQMPDRKRKWKITAEEWEGVKAAVTADDLFTLPSNINCAGCVDQPVEWITVEYSDGTSKTVVANSGEGLTPMIEDIKAALARPATKR